MTQITDHLAEIERRVSDCLIHNQREHETVEIVAVSKRHPASAVIAARAAGLTHFGENYLQEALGKIEAVDDPDIEWHFIGQLQSNKTRPVAETFSWVDTVDRARIAERLDAQRPASAAPLNVLIQLNLDAEAQKGGVSPDECYRLADRIAELPRLRLRGVMSIPQAGQPDAERRARLLEVTAVAAELRSRGHTIDTVSMGMSDDFELAIECGSTMVRIGTALFGERG